MNAERSFTKMNNGCLMTLSRAKSPTDCSAILKYH